MTSPLQLGKDLLSQKLFLYSLEKDWGWGMESQSITISRLGLN